MPLQGFENQAQRGYIRRVRIHVDTDDRIPDESVDIFDFTVDLNNLYEKVASIELVGYNLKNTIQYSFYPSSTYFNGADTVDVWMKSRWIENPIDSTPLTFSVKIPQRRYSRSREFADEFEALLNNGFISHPDFFSYNSRFRASKFTLYISGTDVAPFTTPEELPYLIIRDETSALYAEVRFLFRSGDNSADAAAHQIGFVKNLDTPGFNYFSIPGTLAPTFFLPSTGPSPSRPITSGSATDVFLNQPQAFAPLRFNPARYVDVLIDEFPELQPVGRIPLHNESYAFNLNSVVDSSVYTQDKARPRLLKQPVKTLEKMRIRLRLPEGRLPRVGSAYDGYDLAFDLLLIAPEESVPNWVQQKLIL